MNNLGVACYGVVGAIMGFHIGQTNIANIEKSPQYEPVRPADYDRLKYLSICKGFIYGALWPHTVPWVALESVYRPKWSERHFIPSYRH